MSQATERAATLWSLSAEMLELEDRLLASMDPTTGEADSEVFDSLGIVRETLEAKVWAYAALIRKIDAEADTYAAQAARWREAKESQQRASKRLRDRVHAVMTECGFKRIGPFSVCNNGGKRPVVMQDPHQVPSHLCREVPNLEAIRQTLESGALLPFAYLGDRGTHLRMKP